MRLLLDTHVFLWLRVISVKEHTSLFVLLPSFCVAMTIT
uniref:Uncharacterized protein n=1 Tax=Candidatus Kentrum sp. FM TaxID=2126340 RepID=A0A450WQX7_9GAMM|nr:MAG: hypothetical protein BECKFM1743B_GA0114221_106203 [Candidatus Kentron sp. FM]